MTVHRRPSKSRKKYRPPATGKPKTAVVLLIRNGKVLTVLSRRHATKNEWEELGAKIGTGETVRAAAARNQLQSKMNMLGSSRCGCSSRWCSSRFNSR
jgi:hypothetical protein